MMDNPSWTLVLDTVSAPYYARSGKYLWPWGHLCIYQVKNTKISSKKDTTLNRGIRACMSNFSWIQCLNSHTRDFFPSVELQGRAKPKASHEANQKNRGATKNLNHFESLLLEIREDQIWHLKWRTNTVLWLG